MSVAAEVDRWAWPVLPEGPSMAAELVEWAWPVVPVGLSVAAALDGWPVVPIGLVVTSELGALLLSVVSKGPSVASVLDE